VHLFLLPILPIEKRFTYDAEFKRKVILCAEQFGTHAAVRMLRMSETIVRRWRSTKTACFLSRKVQCHILTQEEQDALKLMPLL
jgi:DNA repair photolyase